MDRGSEEEEVHENCQEYADDDRDFLLEVGFEVGDFRLESLDGGLDLRDFRLDGGDGGFDHGDFRLEVGLNGREVRLRRRLVKVGVPQGIGNGSLVHICLFKIRLESQDVNQRHALS